MSTADSTTRLLVVIGDSLTFYGQDEILGLDHPDTFPHRTAVHLTNATGDVWHAVNAGHGGRTLFDAHKLLRTDEPLRDLISRADAIIIEAVGKDGVLSPFPRPVRLVIGRLPKRYRGRVVRFIRPRLAKLTSRQFQFTPARRLDRCWRGALEEIRSLNPVAHLVFTSPGRPYGPQTIISFPDDWVAPEGHVASVRRRVADAGLPLIDLIPVIDAWVAENEPAPDFLHWPPPMHDAAARRAADVLLGVMSSDAPEVGRRRERATA